MAPGRQRGLFGLQACVGTARWQLQPNPLALVVEGDICGILEYNFNEGLRFRESERASERASERERERESE